MAVRLIKSSRGIFALALGPGMRAQFSTDDGLDNFTDRENEKLLEDRKKNHS